MAIALLLCAVPMAACSTASSPKASAPAVKLAVAAGGKLEKVFPEIGRLFTKSHPGVTFNFGFDEIHNVVQALKQGLAADVFGGIATEFGDQLVAAHLIDRYTVFASNRLILITPNDNPAGIRSMADLRTKPVKLVIAEPASQTGAVTRTALSNLDAVFGVGYSTAVLRKVVRMVPGGTEVSAAVENGSAEAGLVFVPDALPFELNRIELPATARAVAQLPAAVLRTSKHPREAQEFVDFLLSAQAQAVLKTFGFGPPS